MILRSNAICCALLAGVLLSPSVAWAQTNHRTPQPSANPFAGGVAAQGRIVPSGGIIRVSAPAGVTGQAIVDQLLVKRGDTVEAGQLLALLRGRTVLQAQVDAADHDKAAATAAVAQAQAGQAQVAAAMALQLADLEGRLNMADAALHRAVDASRLALEQARREETAAQSALLNAKELQKATLAASTASVALAQSQLDALPKSRTTERSVATAQLDEAKAAKTRGDTEMANQIAQLQAQADLAGIHVRQAEAALVADPAASPAVISPEQAQVLAATAAVAAQKKVMEASAGEGTATVAAAQARLATAESALVVARAQLALSEVHAPSAGRILDILARPGEVVGLAGLLQMGDTREIYVDALVYVDDVPSVHLDQKAMITSSGFTEDGLVGEVVEISPMVAGNTLPNPDPTVFSDQPVVLVKVRLEKPASAANLINGQVKVQFAP